MEKKVFDDLNKYKKNLIFCFTHFPNTFFELFIYWQLIKKKSNVCVFNFNSMISLNSNDDSNIYRAMSYKLIRLFTRPIQIITHKKISLIHLILKSISKYFYPKYIFVSSKKDYLSTKKEWINSQVLRLHSWDGSQFINFKKKI